MPEIYPLEPEGLGAGWPNEAQNFTPWLAENLHLLGAQLSLELELEGTEVTLPGAGRVDILARQAVTNDRVVIENQLGLSDDSHCLRLLGYAANAEANILIWVARDFTPYYRSILNWLNQSNSIDVYAVALKLYRVGDVLGVTFQVEVEPQRDQPEAPALARATMSTRYADFYRPPGDPITPFRPDAGEKGRMAGQMAFLRDRLLPRRYLCRRPDGGESPGFPVHPWSRP